jgi:uncharacterized protein YfaS (alpha-2-macroglobulin family)
MRINRSSRSARLGDFGRGENAPLALRTGDVRIYTDKPLHQPGQTMHVRILARSGDGSARGDAGHLRILDEMVIWRTPPR